VILPVVRPAAIALTLAALFGSAAPVHAERCTESDASVGLRFEGEWAEGRRGAVVAELRAALRVQDLVLCLEVDSDDPPIASLHLVDDGTDTLRVEVRDRVTAKRVERTLRLADFPEDSRALAIAVAADELLRASWAELVLVDAPEPAMEPPGPVRAMVERERRSVTEVTTGRPSAARFLSLGGTLRWHGAGALFGGGELRIEIGVHERVAIALVGTVARAQSEVVDIGSVDGFAVRGGLELVAGLVGGTDSLQLAALAGVRSGWARFEGSPGDPRTEGTELSGVTASVHAGLEGRAHLGAFQLRLGATIGGAFAGVAATANDQRVTGTGGVQIALTLGVGVRL
jgi:hypothetical protein